MSVERDAPPAPDSHSRWRSLPSLLLAASALTVAAFLAPIQVLRAHGYAGEPALVAAASAAFVEAGTSAAGGSAKALADLVRLWADFHLVKACLAAALVVVLAVLLERIRTSMFAGDTPTDLPGSTHPAAHRRMRAVGWSTAYGVVWLWLLGGLTLLLTNLQGFAAPLASTASLLPADQPSPQLSATLAELRAQLAATDLPEGSVAGALLTDFTRYHAVFVGLASVTSIVLVAVAVRALTERWRARSGGGTVPGWLWRLGAAGGAGCFFLFVALANLSTVLVPVPALLTSLASGG